MANRYPRLVINLKHLRHNARQVVDTCAARGISVAGVIKGVAGMVPVAQAMADGGCQSLASSRMEQQAGVKAAGITTPLLMLRVPMLSEVEVWFR